MEISHTNWTLSGRQVKTAVGGLLVVTLVTLLLLSGPDSLPSLQPLHVPSLSNVESMWGSGVVQAPRCSPANHIFFLKTHKCASSTVQNIFLRYGYRNNLTFAFPASGNYLGSPHHFHTNMLPKNLVPAEGKVDMFVLHTRLNPKQHTAILHNDTIWVTIVRDPPALYESLFNYFHMNNAYGMQLSEYSAQPLEKLTALPRYVGKLGRNQMLFDLGYSDNLSVSELRHAIDNLDHHFHLVMISEHMDESLILLRHLLCWTLHDVVVFTKNARRQEVKRTPDPLTLKILRELNSADVILYDHFLARHREAVYKFGEQRMADEVSALRSLRDEYYDDCGAKEVKGRDSSLKFKEYSGLVSAYVTDNNTNINCVMMSMPELALIDTVRRHQKTLLRVLS